MDKIRIKTETIKLDQFLKFSGIACTGSEAKLMIGDGIVYVNGEQEKRRGRKIKKGDTITIGNKWEYALE